MRPTCPLSICAANGRSPFQVGFRAVGDPLRFDGDLAQLPGRHGDLTAEIEAGRAWLARDPRHPLRTEHVDVRQQPPQVGPKAVARMMASKASCLSSAKTTPSVVSRSMPPRTLMLPSLIFLSVPISISGTWPSSSTICRGPLAARRKPSFSKLPSASRRTGALMMSTSRAGKMPIENHPCQIGNPSRSRGMICTGLRTAMVTSTFASARSSAISPPELPKPTTRTRWPAKAWGLR